MVYSGGDRKRKIAEHIRQTSNTNNVNLDKRVEQEEKRKRKIMDHIKKSGS